MSYTAIDLSAVPAPDAVEALDVEVLLSGLKAELVMLAPELAPVISLESEPVVKLLEVFALREVLLRARVNDAARAVMLATATGADLDNLAALMGVGRLTISPTDPGAVPPVLAVMETDSDLRRRTQLALEGFSTAGPTGAYLYHALSADADVLDVAVSSPAPGQVRLVVLSRSGNGVPGAGLVSTVANAVNADRVRPLCDSVTVVPAAVVNYQITAQLVMFDGPDAAAVRDAAEAAARVYAQSAHRIGRTVRLSGILAALHRPGVERVVLTSPAADVAATGLQAPWCTAVTVTVA